MLLGQGLVTNEKMGSSTSSYINFTVLYVFFSMDFDFTRSNIKQGNFAMFLTAFLELVC